MAKANEMLKKHPCIKIQSISKINSNIQFNLKIPQKNNYDLDNSSTNTFIKLDAFSIPKDSNMSIVRPHSDKGVNRSTVNKKYFSKDDYLGKHSLQSQSNSDNFKNSINKTPKIKYLKFILFHTIFSYFLVYYYIFV